jgi:exo-beta-1,3-glucanase (GH17 family)
MLVRKIVIIALVLTFHMLLVGCGETKPPLPAIPTYSPTHTLSSNPVPCGHAPSSAGLLRLSGLSYSPYRGEQSPYLQTSPSSDEVQADMLTLKSLTDNIRIYSSLDPASEILQAASTNSMKVDLGIWLSSVSEANDAEIAAGEQLASSKVASSLTVGSEVLLRGDLTENQLHQYLQQVRAKVGHTVPITMADEYHQWLQHKALANDVDFITVHIYPFWNAASIDCAMHDLDAAYKEVVAAFPGKRIVIGETGWPSAISSQPETLPGSTRCSAQDGTPPSPTASPTQLSTGHPSPANQALYLRDFTTWAEQNGVEYYFFDAFDESWKTQEQGVGTHWGLYQQNGQLKPNLSGLLPAAAPATVTQRSYFDIAVGGLEPSFNLEVDTSEHRSNWIKSSEGVITLDYPASQQWGLMYISVCKPVPPKQRQFSLNLSAYRSLAFDMRSTTNNQCVNVGIKDWKQPDDGTEQTVSECPTTQWTRYTQPLAVFSHADRTHLYVVFEVILHGTSSTTIQIRNVRYFPN